MSPDELVIRPTTANDLDAVGDIYAHHVEQSVATFELSAPDAVEWDRRWRAVKERGLPFLTATVNREVVGYAYCAPWKTRPAYRHTVEDSI